MFLLGPLPIFRQDGQFSTLAGRGSSPPCVARLGCSADASVVELMRIAARSGEPIKSDHRR